MFAIHLGYLLLQKVIKHMINVLKGYLKHFLIKCTCSAQKANCYLSIFNKCIQSHREVQRKHQSNFIPTSHHMNTRKFVLLDRKFSYWIVMSQVQPSTVNTVYIASPKK